MKNRLWFIVRVILLWIATSASGQSWITSITPATNALSVLANTNISIVFSQDINPTTLTNTTIRIHGSQSGLHPGNINYVSGTKTLTIDPLNNFQFGEIVTLILTRGIQNLIGDPIPNSYQWSFKIQVGDGSGVFAADTTFDIVGGANSLTMGDFDGDGDIDIITMSYFAGGYLCLLRNNGTGVFQMNSTLTGGAWGIASGDWDCDGDLDLLTGNFNGIYGSLKLSNDGSGIFSGSSFPLVESGATGKSLASGDWDGDGNLDIVISGIKTHVFFNDGLGNFSLGNTFPDANDGSIATGDFDHDGDIDFVTGRGVFVNNGNGIFTVDSTLNFSGSRTAADFDGDGDLDLVENNKIWKNDGNGHFVQDSTVAATGPNTTGDFNGDADIDLIVGDKVFFNNGNGKFNQISTLNVTLSLGELVSNSSYNTIAAGDLDGDGDLDLAVIYSYGPGKIMILKNRPFQPHISVSRRTLDFGKIRTGFSEMVLLKIFNESGSNPLNITNIVSSNPSIFSAIPTTASINAMDSLTLSVTFNPANVQSYRDSISIFTNDPVEPVFHLYVKGICAPIVSSVNPPIHGSLAGRMGDISATFNTPMRGNLFSEANYRVFGETSGRNFGQITYDNGTKTSHLSTNQKFAYGEMVQAILTEENRSSPDSIPLIYGYSWKFRVSPRFGSGVYKLDPTSYPAGTSPFGIASGDLDRNGFPDLVCTNSGQSNISVYLNNGYGLFQSAVNYNVGISPQGVAVADFDGDGDPDLAVTNNSSNTVSILINNGYGIFSSPVNYSVGTAPRAVGANDLDNDGDNDLVITNVTSNDITILLNDGLGNFGNGVTIPVGAAPSGISLEDLDRDGDIDLAVSNKNSNTISIIINSKRIFVVDSMYSTGTAPNAIFASDFDGDGDIDIATANGTSNDISILRNNGSGVFGSPASIGSGNQPIGLYGNDLDADGDMDLAVINFGTNNVIVFRNNGSGGFTGTDTIAVGSNPRGITGSDFSGEFGIIDLAVVNLTSGNISILKNQTVDFPPTIPKNFNVRDGVGRAILKWRKSSDTNFLRYRIYGGMTPGPLAVLDSTSGGILDTTRVILGLADGVKYYFRVTAIDSNRNESDYSNEVNVIPGAPAAPQILSAVPGNQKTTLKWSRNTEVDFLRYHIFQGTAPNPTQKVDSTSGGRADTTRIITGLTNGITYYFRIAAIDSNYNQSNFSNEVNSTPVLIDNTPPVFGTRTAPSVIELNSNIDISILITDTESGVDSVRLYYRRSGDMVFSKTDMNGISGTYSAHIPALLVTEKGVEYYIHAADNLGNTNRTPIYSIQVQVSNGVSRTDPTNGTSVYQPSGNTIDAYSLFAIPLILDDPSASTFITANPVLGGYNKKVWRWYDFDRSSQQFVEYPGFSSLSADHGYMLIIDIPNIQIKSGSGRTVMSNQPYVISLSQGWSIIGNPFNYDIPYDSISVASGTFELVSWVSGGWQVNTTGLKAWEGYAINVSQNTTFRIRAGRAGLNKEANPFDLTTLDESNWIIHVMANLNGAKDTYNYFGQLKNASNEYDLLDLHEPPAFGEIRLELIHPNWQDHKNELFTTDIRKDNAIGQYYDFDLVTGTGDGVGTLSFEGIQGLPVHYLVYLVDKNAKSSMNLRTRREVQFTPAISGKKQYRLLVGTEEFVSRNSEGIQLFPTQFRLVQNYPNPFNPETNIQYSVPEPAHVRLEIFNLLGQKVRTLVDENQPMDNYLVVWNSRNDNSILMPSGIYFYRISAGKFVQTRKMILLK